LFLLILSTPALIQAANCDEIRCTRDTQDEETYLRCNKDKQACWEGKIREAQGQANTLNNTISILNGKIQVQELQISQTTTEIQKLEREIGELSTRITGLELSLDRMSAILIERAKTTYKQSTTNPFLLLTSSDSLSDFMTEYKYVQMAQRHISQVMKQAEAQRLDYDQQKALKEAKQTEVEQKKIQLLQQQKTLSQQKAEQQHLLAETKNNEALYQKELARTLAELKAIQSIIAGRGAESSVGNVNQGDTIASIIQGSSACSTGTHLHFEVTKDGGQRNPADYLKSADVKWDNSPDGAFSFGGSWDWPVFDPARITQGYGMTYYARVRRAYGGSPHTGIDLVSKGADFRVRAVKNGKLSRGSISCGGGQLRYVKVAQDDGIDTYYLHVNY
jgi:peptidoglycan hydrolase CwlO-like protein